jgi:hypothetical protein
MSITSPVFLPNSSSPVPRSGSPHACITRTPLDCLRSSHCSHPSGALYESPAGTPPRAPLTPSLSNRCIACHLHVPPDPTPRPPLLPEPSSTGSRPSASLPSRTCSANDHQSLAPTSTGMACSPVQRLVMLVEDVKSSQLTSYRIAMPAMTAGKTRVKRRTLRVARFVNLKFW